MVPGRGVVGHYIDRCISMTIPVCGRFMWIGWLASKGYGKRWPNGLWLSGFSKLAKINGLKLSKQSGPV